MKTPAEILEPNNEGPKKCRECGAEFSLPFPMVFAHLITICPECAEKQIEIETRNAIAQAQQDRLSKWERICPPAYRETISTKLPRPDLLKRVLAWHFGRRGLLIHGKTGTGKSRCAWLLMKREFEAKRSVLALDNMALGVDYPARFSVSCEEVAVWVHRLCEVDILFLDDPFKVKLTERVEELLFTVINRRVERHKPIVVTSNDTGPSLEERMSADRAAPLIRRLREHCQVISALPPNTNDIDGRSGEDLL